MQGLSSKCRNHIWIVLRIRQNPHGSDISILLFGNDMDSYAIAAIDFSHGAIRFAYFDNGTLIHNRRMSDYWHNNYQKLFGEIKEVRAVACRKTCYFTTSDDIFVHIKSSTKRLTLCTANNRAQTVKTVKDCRSTQTHQLPDSKGFTTIYKQDRPSSQNTLPELTIKLPTKSHHKWHPDKAVN